MQSEKVFHEIAPVYDAASEILILGSFPSVKSRETKFFYGHPQNRFWKVLSALAGEELPVSINEKKRFLLKNHIAVWDVIASCDIEGSSDSSIKNVCVNDLSLILEHSSVKRIYCNGGKAYELYRKYCRQKTGREAVKLPSTSPANASMRLERLIDLWYEAGVLKDLKISGTDVLPEDKKG